LQAELEAAGFDMNHVHLIGGALEAGELDAKRAIAQGFKLALNLAL
jgi:2,4-dienoyl-CoA reductase (NADPH2)